MPKIFVPFVAGRLNPATLSAVLQCGLPYRLEDIDPNDDGAYGRMFRFLWAQKDTFVICEQDVIPTQAQLWAISACNHDWCSYNYGDGLYPDGPMFGLVRFGGALMAREPWMAEDALILGKRRDTEAAWWQVDAQVARSLRIRGVEWVAHETRVTHAHVNHRENV